MKLGWFLGGCLITTMAASAMAVDRYELQVPPVVMRGDPDIPIQVIPHAGLEIDYSSHAVVFSGLPVGVSIAPSSPGGFPIQGPATFHLSFSPSLSVERLILKVQKADDPDVFWARMIRVERPVARLRLVPAPPFGGKSGDFLVFQIAAVDDRGSVVTSFKGDVTLSTTGGTLNVGRVPGERFQDGLAKVTVKFIDTDAGGTVTLSAATTHAYGGRTEPARGSFAVTLQPGTRAP